MEQSRWGMIVPLTERKYNTRSGDWRWAYVFRTGLRNLPVWLFFDLAICSGVPSATS